MIKKLLRGGAHTTSCLNVIFLIYKYSVSFRSLLVGKTIKKSCNQGKGAGKKNRIFYGLLPKKQYGFFTTLADPPPPGLAKDHKKYGFFFRHPSLTYYGWQTSGCQNIATTYFVFSVDLPWTCICDFPSSFSILPIELQPFNTTSIRSQGLEIPSHRKACRQGPDSPET